MSKYENHDFSKQSLPFIFKKHTVVGSGLKFSTANWHENVELLHVISGDGFASNNGKIISLTKGDTAVFDHNNLHSVATSSSLTYRYLIIDRSFCVENDFDTSKIHFLPKISDERITKLIDELESLYSLPENAPYRALAIKTTVLSLMLLLCKEYSRENAAIARPEGGASHIKMAIEYINDSYARDISLDEVAEHIGVSKFYLSHEFNKYVGCSFVSYMNGMRCKKAKRLLLETSLPITEIASLCGFHSCSYFAKMFERYEGALPKSFRTKVAHSESY